MLSFYLCIKKHKQICVIEHYDMIGFKYFSERSGYHPALAKVDSAPSASVGMHGINTGLCGQTSAIHANSEASLLKIHHNKHDSTAASIMVCLTYYSTI